MQKVVAIKSKKSSMISIPTAKEAAGPDGKSYFTYEVHFQGKVLHRRYRQFNDLNSLLVGMYPVQTKDLGCRLPKKTPFNQDPVFIEERRVLLENYLRHVLSVKELALSSPMKSFLEVDEVIWQSPTEAGNSSGFEDIEVRGVSDHAEDEFDKFLRPTLNNNNSGQDESQFI